MMNLAFKQRQAQQGSSLIEVLVTLVILMLGLLGLVGLMLQSQRSQMESYQRVQALVVLQDMVNRINANRKAALCYAITTGADGTPYVGTGSAATPACAAVTDPPLSTEQKAQADQDIMEWSSLLKGEAEQSADGADVGGMLGARGCLAVVEVAPVCPNVPVPPLSPNKIYDVQVSVVWQGNGKTAAPSSDVTCAKGLYGDDALRRAVTATSRINTAISHNSCDTQP